MSIPPASDGAVLHRLFVTADDGCGLSVVVARPADGARVMDAAPPILAAHGFASSAVSGWGRTGHFDALARAGRTVIAPDLRAHGESDKPHDVGAYTVDAVLADLVASVRAAVPSIPPPSSPLRLAGSADGAAVAADTTEPGHGSIDLLGYSLGARLCWSLACRAMLPVRSMVLGGFDGRPLFENVDTDRLDALIGGVPGNDRDALAALVEGLAGSGDGADDAGGAALPAVPTLLVAGERDPFAAGAARLARHLTHGRFVAVPGRDHISTVPASRFRRGAADFLSTSV